MTIRQRTQDLERQYLSPLAVCSADSAGRARPAEEDDIRTAFARDRDRILHCNAFRRLKHKTQVFLSPLGDHYRTRLTHTLEVSQIARTISRALRLNEDLTEAIALGHDLGHTPFGHAGERALAHICPHGFVHAAQSVRVVEELERDGQGLNLTHEVRNGIACHTQGPPAETLEGRVVRYADKIAYLNHDFDDAVRAGVLTEEELPYLLRYTLGNSKSARIGCMVNSIIENSREDITMAPQIQRAFEEFRSFMFEALYTHPIAKGEEGKAQELVQQLYRYFVAHPRELPAEYGRILAESDVDRAVSDYISGMTDRYAVALFSELFVPQSWGDR